MELSCYDSFGTDFDVSRELLGKERYTGQDGVSYWDIKIHIQDIFRDRSLVIIIFRVLNLGYLREIFHNNFGDYS